MTLSPAAITLTQTVYNWLGQHGFPVTPYQSVEGAASADNRSSASADPGMIYWTPGYSTLLESLASRLGRRGRLTTGQIEAARVALHEGIHQMRFGRTPGVYQGDYTQPGTGAYWEEASTDAVARDLLPIFTAQIFGHKLNPQTITDSYDLQVTNLRQLSVYGSGSKNYRTYKARVWRRSFNHADQATREQMANAAMQVRQAARP